ncbi:hypothetical protein OG2516_04893 [Oceanicola granulosus HTCC2516]|uniref:HTH gntR-type domain-containing protein n=2 Tax=Oceanicola granulosus TaxID=252302 RepID=Q2CC09_OCEGH|nr:hypothetical protein OG2516_04893 [Oceanicola granulosus HTCC2516]
MLIRDITAGRLVDGQRLPPERQMAQELGVSVGTLRKALEGMAEQGLLERVQGSGNYIRVREAVESVYAFFRLESPTGAGLPSGEILSIERMEKPDDLPPFGQSTDAHRVRRLREMDGEPVALEEVWLDGVWAERLKASQIVESLHFFYKETLGLEIRSVEDRLGAREVPDWAPARFGVAPGDVSAFCERRSTGHTGEVVEYGRFWFDSSKANYVSRLKQASARLEK